MKIGYNNIDERKYILSRYKMIDGTGYLITQKQYGRAKLNT